jgi:malate synthase
MEDAATAEISRTQVWQWIAHRAPLADGTIVTPDRLRAILEEELARVRGEVGEARFTSGRFAEARELFEGLVLAPQLEEFLTLPAYRLLTQAAART